MGRISYWYQDLKEKLKPMSFRQKLSYFFTYYKGWLLGLLVLILFAGYIGDFLVQRNKETVLEGFFTNDDYGVFNAKEILDDFADTLTLQKNQNIIMDDDLYIDLEGGARDYSAASNGKIIAYMSVGELDFVVTCKEIYEHYAGNVPMLDLSSVLSPELNSELAPYYVYGSNIDSEGKEGSAFPAAVELSQSRFLKDRPDVPEGTYYLFAPYQAPHREALADFIEFCFAG